MYKSPLLILGDINYSVLFKNDKDTFSLVKPIGITIYEY